ncbi:MAG: membrane protein insertion efficiency factor YidD [Christensenellaceae bacterium]|nr:membrane protein insertion efficiency factor YidD [Christensenellaceae bacterium]
MKKLLLKLIDFYQKQSAYRPPCCRFVPTCSAYAKQALTEYGVWRGVLLSVWRVLRCNPLVKGGYDPIPDRFLGRVRKKDE